MQPVYLEHDFVILSITHSQDPFRFDVQVLQELLNALAFACTRRQNLHQFKDYLEWHIAGMAPDRLEYKSMLGRAAVIKLPMSGTIRGRQEV